MITEEELRTLSDKQLRRRIREFVAFEMHQRDLSYKWFCKTSRSLFLRIKKARKDHLASIN